MLSAKRPDSKPSMHAVALKCRILPVLPAGGCSTQGVHFHMQAGAFRIGDTAGTLDNIAACKLHRPGSVGFVSKSGGMSNEMYNVLSRTTDGLYEGERLPQGHVEHLLAAHIHSLKPEVAAFRDCKERD